MEIRDPIHQFITVSDLERRVIDTRPVQRLRQIHQLSTAWLVWPGAQHTRFEHALGTMELAGRALNAAFRNSDKAILDRLGLSDTGRQKTMESIARLGGLLHDVGHTPFSHGAEALLPEEGGVALHHETLTDRLIAHEEIRVPIEQDPLDSVDIQSVAAVAAGPEVHPTQDQNIRLLSDLVTGAVGVDRMDYLLRDAYFTGVAYGKFDIERLISSLKIVESEDVGGPVWAVPAGAVYDAEQMLLARWFMHLQVYFHKTRRILDIHLRNYLQDTLAGGRFPSPPEEYLSLTDYKILDEALQSNHPEALALLRRNHLRMVREFSVSDFESPEAFLEFADSLNAAVPEIVHDHFKVTLTKPGDGELWVETTTGPRPLSEVSMVLETLKPRWIGRIYAPFERRSAAASAIANLLQESHQ